MVFIFLLDLTELIFCTTYKKPKAPRETDLGPTVRQTVTNSDGPSQIVTWMEQTRVFTRLRRPINYGRIKLQPFVSCTPSPPFFSVIEKGEARERVGERVQSPESRVQSKVKHRIGDLLREIGNFSASETCRLRTRRKKRSPTTRPRTSTSKSRARSSVSALFFFFSFLFTFGLGLGFWVQGWFC